MKSYSLRRKKFSHQNLNLQSKVNWVSLWCFMIWKTTWIKTSGLSVQIATSFVLSFLTCVRWASLLDRSGVLSRIVSVKTWPRYRCPWSSMSLSRHCRKVQRCSASVTNSSRWHYLNKTLAKEWLTWLPITQRHTSWWKEGPVNHSIHYLGRRMSLSPMTTGFMLSKSVIIHLCLL